MEKRVLIQPLFLVFSQLSLVKLKKKRPLHLSGDVRLPEISKHHPSRGVDRSVIDAVLQKDESLDVRLKKD